jgi:hypothetical protein
MEEAQALISGVGKSRECFARANILNQSKPLQYIMFRALILLTNVRQGQKC